MVGRKKIVLTEKNQKVVNEYLSKKINSKEASKRLNIGGSTFFRLVAEFRANSGLEPFYIGRGGRKPGQKKTGSKTVSLKTQDEFFEPTLLEIKDPETLKIKFFEDDDHKFQNGEVSVKNKMLMIYNKKGELLFLAKKEMFLTKAEVLLFIKRAGIDEEIEIVFDFDPQQLIGKEKEGYCVKFYDAELKKCYCTKDSKVFVVDPSFFL
jgi:hypothetical protein